ncbi:S8 family serine peptidase [Actinomadura sp. HBU206391]|uniref:S8 family serine peptidase n=1 Tax=Actinomadura sp. HBU206391 TaxID=2731692 RepID=UPI00165091D2|nr:S8 family serine peptidase [Actinomadura sp. HBU206391]MBC6458611.1 S8 family serine peptidase [Actinomadura sp. HBU206391]
MLTRVVHRAAAAAAGCLLVFVPASVPAVPAHTDSLEWVRRLGRDIRAAQQVTMGRGVTVAIVADGVDGRIDTLRGKVKPGRAFVKPKGAEKVTGTLVATLLAGSGPSYRSPLGIRGLAPGVKILPVRVMPSSEERGAKSWFDDANMARYYAEGIRYAADQGAQVIWALPFWGDDSELEELRAAVLYAQRKGSVLVAGNDPVEGWQEPSEPAASPGVIGVGAIGVNGKRLPKFSGVNSGVLVSAPGIDLPSIGPGESLWRVRGPLPATTFVAATAALVISEYPRLPPQLVARAIAESAHHPKAGYDTSVGFGVINPAGLDRAAKLEGRSAYAPASAGAISERTRFGPGPVQIKAVRYDTGVLVGFSGLIAVGALAIAAAVVLAVRGRCRTARAAQGAGAFAPPSVAPPPPSSAPRAS